MKKRVNLIGVWLVFLPFSIFAQEEEIIYDDISNCCRYHYNCMEEHSCYAVRFTPPYTCEVKAAKIGVYVPATARSCTAFVFDDQNGVPGSKRIYQAFMPQAGGARFNRVDFPTPITYTNDFWIVLAIPGRDPNAEIGALSDYGHNYPGRSYYGSYRIPVWYDGSQSWLYGDLLIRAIVSRSGIEEELSSGDILILNQNSPNPVVNETIISYVLPWRAKVELTIYDIFGKRVRNLINAERSPGLNKIVWDRKDELGKAVCSGVYFYKLSVDNTVSFTKVMIVL